MEYEIMLGGQAMGKATVRRQGLYYEFDCSCRLSGESMFCLTVSCGDQQENLGILVPENGQFVLHTRLPVKRLGEGMLRFEAIPKHPKLDEVFIPLSPEAPFHYLQRLEDAYLQVRDRQLGIILRGQH